VVGLVPEKAGNVTEQQQAGEQFDKDESEPVQVRDPEEPARGFDGDVDTPNELWTLIDERINRFESRVFDRDRENAAWSITNEIRYGNDVVTKAIDDLRAELLERIDGIPAAVWGQVLDSLADGKKYAAADFVRNIDRNTAPQADNAKLAGQG
jgi:hypothetical protein